MATTKTKKAAPQIDVRETFVSLQKDFGETGIPVAEKLKVLYALQQADNEIDKIKNLRGALPQEVAQIEDELAGLHSKVAHHEELIAGYEASIEENKNQIVDLDAEIAKYQEQLSNISNSREYDSISKEIENLGLLREIAQKHIGEARIAIGERRDAIDALGDRIAIREQDLAAKKEELETIVASTSEEEKALQARRDECAAKIDERTMSAYDRIRGSVRNHLAVVTVYNGDSCGGCFNAITPQRLVEIASGRKLVICEHCGRILVNPDAEVQE